MSIRSNEGKKEKGGKKEVLNRNFQQQPFTLLLYSHDDPLISPVSRGKEWGEKKKVFFVPD